MTAPVVIAIPKGRIQEELLPMFARVGIEPEKSFFDDAERQLQFSTSQPHISLIRVRSFDVATFVAFGAAQLGIAGSDVLEEFEYAELYAPLDLGIGKCRLAMAAPKAIAGEDFSRASHIRIATKYPNMTTRHFAAKGIQAECIRLSGAMELAPKLGLAPRIVDLVSSGKTLAANGLVEVEKIADVSSRLIVNRAAYKTRGAEMTGFIERFAEASHALAA